MTKSDILLSICVPTFNRAISLERTLGMIISQMDGYESIIEVVILDNCSPDDTEEVARQYAEKYNYIRYYKNHENIGFDRNVDSVIKKSSGEFVWILADDDYIEQNSIGKIINVIVNNSEANFILLNYALYKDDFKTFVSNSRVNALSNCIAIDGNDFYSKAVFANSFVSSNVFRRASWVNAKPDQYYDTGWIHFYVARDILLDSKSYIISDRIVRQGRDISRLRIRSRTEYDIYMKVFFEFLTFVYQLPQKGYNKSIYVLGKKLFKGETLRQIVFLKISLSNYDLKYFFTIAYRMINYYKFDISFWVIDLPVLFLPNNFIRSMYNFAKPMYVKYKKSG